MRSRPDSKSRKPGKRRAQDKGRGPLPHDDRSDARFERARRVRSGERGLSRVEMLVILAGLSILAIGSLAVPAASSPVDGDPEIVGSEHRHVMAKALHSGKVLGLRFEAGDPRLLNRMRSEWVVLDQPYPWRGAPPALDAPARTVVVLPYGQATPFTLMFERPDTPTHCVSTHVAALQCAVQ